MNKRNLLNQLTAARRMYYDFIDGSENSKKIIARETFESLISLQQMLSKAIVEVYKEIDK